MSRNKEQQDYDVFAPSKGTNHLLDPTQVNKSFELGTTDKEIMMRRLSGDKTDDKRIKESYGLKAAFTADNAKSTYGLGTHEEQRAMERIEARRHEPKTRGGGPKSTLRTPRKMFSSFGRGVPFSGGLAGFFKAGSAGPAVGYGARRHFIPNQGLFDMGTNVGPKTLQGLSFNGAFPMLNYQQFSTSHAATPHDAEEED
jgi:hypothetical protein